MIILCCETSTLMGSVALVKNETLLVEKSAFRQGSHSDNLHLNIKNCLHEAQLKLENIDLFATGIGPGSFTGIRISLNTQKSFSFVYNKPMLSMDSLTSIAYQAHALQPDLGPVFVMINAFKNMVYYAQFESQKNSLVTVTAPGVIRVQDLKKLVTSNVLCLGDGYLAYEDYFKTNFPRLLVRNSVLPDYPLASTIGLNSKILTKSSWQDLLPIYIRASEAEENLQGIKYQPL